LKHSENGAVVKICANGYEGHPRGYFVILWSMIFLFLVILSIINLSLLVKKKVSFEKFRPWRLSSVIFHFAAAIFAIIFTAMGVSPFIEELLESKYEHKICWLLTRYWNSDCEPSKAAPITVAGIFGCICSILYASTGMLELLDKY
jgi:hypothetical protein